MRPLRVSFLGAKHPHILPRLQICRESEGIEITGLYDPDPQIRASLAAQYDVRTVAAPDSLWEGPRLDLIIVEGFDPENPGYAQMAAPHARALLIEKPGAPNLRAMENLVAFARQSGIHVQIGYMYHYSPVVAKVREILAAGVLGTLTLARFHAAAPVGCAAEIWQSITEDMGGVFFTDGCHMLDLIVHLLGEPRSATGRVLKLTDGPQVIADIFKPDLLAGLGREVPMQMGRLRHEDGAVAILEYDRMLATLDVTGWEAHNWVEAWRMEFYGTDGTLHVSLVPPGYRLWVRRPSNGFAPGWHSWEGTGTATGAGASLAADETYQNELADLFTRIREGRAPDLSRLEEALAVVRVVDAVYRSAGWLPEAR